MPGSVDPQWGALAGAAGGLVSALVRIGVVSLAADPAGRCEITPALIEGAWTRFTKHCRRRPTPQTPGCSTGWIRPFRLSLPATLRRTRFA